MLTSLVAVVLAASPLAPATALAPTPRPSQKVPINVLNVTGTGCKPGTTTVAMSGDNTAFTVLFSGYVASVGAGTKTPDANRTCRIKLKLSAVPGFSHTITTVDNRGYASLAAGVTATALAGYTFQGSPPAVDQVHTFVGPLVDGWQTTDGTDPAASPFGPCGAARNLTITSTLHVDLGRADPTAFSMIAMDAVDGALPLTYHLGWRAC